MVVNITDLTELLPDSVMKDIIYDEDVELKDGRMSTRITVGHILTNEEKIKMKSKRILGVDCVCHHKYGPEIKHSYFYVV